MTAASGESSLPANADELLTWYRRTHQQHGLYLNVNCGFINNGAWAPRHDPA
jgi:hypothetical protein